MKKSDAVVALIEKALIHDNELQKQKWVAGRGSSLKTQPSATDLGKCPRQVYYSLRNIPETNPPDMQSLANFKFGHAAEEGYAQILEQLPGFEKMVIIREVRLEIDGVSGRADFILWDPHLRCIIELKTTKGWQVKFLPNSDHEKQISFYLKAGQLGMLRKYGIEPDDCDTGVIVYIRKDATRGYKTILAFDVHYDEAMLDRELDKLATVSQQAKEAIEPPRPKGFTETKFPCGWCSWKDHCWK